ncbi:MAG: DUF1178 family protein [Alphaproteobacteria bacterium]|nr:DUF1178 family protein [Alphaproteobacteria bacterium]
MIHYQLRCADDHGFEAWFRDSATYDEQVANGDVECPYCGSTRVSRAPMAPFIASGRAAKADAPAPSDEQPTDIHHMTDQRAQEVAQQILDAVGKIRQYAEDNLEDVGKDFAEEARKIHYGEAEERGIRGQASDEEARELEEEGVEFFRLPGANRRDS